jgi:hypothetical protein
MGQIEWIKVGSGSLVVRDHFLCKTAIEVCLLFCHGLLEIRLGFMFMV